MQSCLLVISTFALALPPSLPRAERPNPFAKLCKADEEAYAGCRLHGSGKLLAFCIAKGTQLPSTPMGDRAPRLVVPKARTLVYRFGRPGRIELEYPKRRAGSAAKFRYAQAAYSRGGETRVRFHNGGFRYGYVSRLIARGQGQGHDNYHSLSIYRGMMRVALLKCEDANTINPRVDRAPHWRHPGLDPGTIGCMAKSSSIPIIVWAPDQVRGDGAWGKVGSSSRLLPWPARRFAP